MNDDFIYRALPEVPKKFATSLYRKISARTAAVSPRKSGFKKRWMPAILISLGLFMFVAWLQIRWLVRYVQVGDLWLVEYERSTQTVTGDQAAVPFVPSPLPTPWIYDGTSTPPPEIVETFVSGRFFYSPAWIPEGFEATTLPREMISWEETLGVWSNDARQNIRLFIAPKAGGMRPSAPAGMWKEVSIKGEPAVLIYGRLALTSPENPRAQRQWDETLGLQLHWIMGEDIYALETFGPYVSEQDLILMAESMQEIPIFWFTSTP